MNKRVKRVGISVLLTLATLLLILAFVFSFGVSKTKNAFAAGSWTGYNTTGPGKAALYGAEKWIAGGDSGAATTAADGEYTKFKSWYKGEACYYTYGGTSNSATALNVNGLSFALKIPYEVFSAEGATGLVFYLASSASVNAVTKTHLYSAGSSWNIAFNVFRQYGTTNQIRVCFSSSYGTNSDSTLDNGNNGGHNVAYADTSGSSFAWANHSADYGSYITMNMSTSGYLYLTVKLDTNNDSLYNGRYVKATITQSGGSQVPGTGTLKSSYTCYLDWTKFGSSLAGTSPYRTYLQVNTSQRTTTGNNWGICVGGLGQTNLSTSGTLSDKAENGNNDISNIYCSSGAQYANNGQSLTLDGLTIDYFANGLNFASGNVGGVGVALVTSSSANPMTTSVFSSYIYENGSSAAVYFANGSGGNIAYYMSSAGVLSPFWGSSGEMYAKKTGLSSSTGIRVVMRFQNCKADTYTFSDIFPNGYVIIQYDVRSGSSISDTTSFASSSSVNSQVIYVDGDYFNNTMYLSVWGQKVSGSPFTSAGGKVSLTARWNTFSNYKLTLRDAACTGTQTLTFMNSRTDVWTYIQLPYRKDAFGNAVAYYKVSGTKYYPGDKILVASLSGQTLTAYYLDIAINGTSINTSNGAVKYSGMATYQYKNSIYSDVTATEIGLIVFPTDKVASSRQTSNIIYCKDSFTLANYPAGSSTTSSYNATCAAPASGDFETVNVTIANLNTYNYGRDIAVRGYVRVGSTYYYGLGGTYSKSAHVAACQSIGSSTNTYLKKYAESSLEIQHTGSSGSVSVSKVACGGYTSTTVSSITKSSESGNTFTIKVVFSDTQYLQGNKIMALYVTANGIRTRYAISSQSLSSKTLTLSYTIKG